MKISFAPVAPASSYSGADARVAAQEPSAPFAQVVAPPPATATHATENARIDEALTAVNRLLQPVATNLRFVKDDSSGRMMVRVIDAETQKVLRQMPTEEVLAMNKALDHLQGLMVKLKV